MSVKHGLLAVLNRRSMHGYELRKELVDGLGPEWNVNYGQVYSTLERLVRDGLCVQSETVSVVDAPDRKLYTVTPAGRAELQELVPDAYRRRRGRQGRAVRKDRAGADRGRGCRAGHPGAAQGAAEANRTAHAVSRSSSTPNSISRPCCRSTSPSPRPTRSSAGSTPQRPRSSRLQPAHRAASRGGDAARDPARSSPSWSPTRWRRRSDERAARHLPAQGPLDTHDHRHRRGRVRARGARRGGGEHERAARPAAAATTTTSSRSWSPRTRTSWGCRSARARSPKRSSTRSAPTPACAR